MRKLLVTGIMLIILIIGLVTSACGQKAAPTPTSTPSASQPTTVATPKPTPTSTPAPVKPVVLKFSDSGPPSGAKATVWQNWSKELEQKTGGRVKVEWFWSQVLAKATENREAIAKGVADGGLWVAIYEPAKFQLWQVGEIPLMSPNIYVANMAMNELYKTEPALKAQFDAWDVELLFPVAPGAQNIFSTKPIAKLDDLKGKKMSFVTDAARLFSQFGVSIVSLPSADMYTALERGVIDGVGNPINTYRDYGWSDIAKNVVLTGHGQTTGYGLIINRNVLKGLPDDVKKIIQDLREKYAVEQPRIYINGEKEIIETTKQKGVVYRQFSAEDWAKLVSLTKPFAEEWIKKQESEGRPGQKVYDSYAKLYAKYDSELKKNGYPWEKK